MNVAATYNNLGVLARKEIQYKEAEAYHQKALRLRMEKLGENHVDVADTYNNLGTVCHNQNMHEKARDYYQKALARKSTIIVEVAQCRRVENHAIARRCSPYFCWLLLMPKNKFLCACQELLILQ